MNEDGLEVAGGDEGECKEKETKLKGVNEIVTGEKKIEERVEGNTDENKENYQFQVVFSENTTDYKTIESKRITQPIKKKKQPKGNKNHKDNMHIIGQQEQAQPFNQYPHYSSTPYMQHAPYWLQHPYYYPPFSFISYPNYASNPSQAPSLNQSMPIQSQSNQPQLNEERELEVMRLKVKLSNYESESLALKDKLTEMEKASKDNKAHSTSNSQFKAKLRESKEKITYLKEKNEKYCTEINSLKDIINETNQKCIELSHQLKEKSNQVKLFSEEKNRSGNYLAVLKKENDSFKANIAKVENESTRLYDQIDAREKNLHELKRKMTESETRNLSLKIDYEALTNNYYKLKAEHDDLLGQYDTLKENNELLMKELSKIALDAKRRKKLNSKIIKPTQSYNMTSSLYEYYYDKDNDDYRLYGNDDLSRSMNYSNLKRNPTRQTSFSYGEPNRVNTHEKLIEDYENKLIELSQFKNRVLLALHKKNNKVFNMQYPEKDYQREVIKIDREIDRYTNLINGLRINN